MTETREVDPTVTLQQFAEFAERSQKIATDFWMRQAEEMDPHEFHLADAHSLGKAFMDFSAHMMTHPQKLIQAQMDLYQKNMALWQNTMARMLGQEAEPVVQPEKGDRRFKDEAWSEDLLFDYVKQSYLLSAHFLRDVVKNIDGDIDPKTKEKVEFYTRQFISATAPSNFALTNPTVLKKAQESNGQNLIEGFRHMLDDLERGKGRLRVSMVKHDAFEIGRNIALTPGKVVYQNELMQLIQYSPSTEQVHKRPLLIVPAWINKFYILDLQPKNSFVKWATDQGHTVFLISWINPRSELGHKSFSDYMLEGPLAAIDAIEQATGVNEVNVIGFCIGGILISATLGYLAARGDDRIKSATFFATMFDFKNVGEISVFVNQEQIEQLEQQISEKGYLEGRHMMDMFSMMRENDLIWSFVVNNYLMGREPPPFDLLYWNADSTRLPATMLLWYIKEIYGENKLMKPGGLSLNGVPIDLRKSKTPVYLLATREDHIAPWTSCYPGARAFGGEKRFILGASGHIAGVINPPSQRKKYGFWHNPEQGPDPEAWFKNATFTEGSWWPDWEAWVEQFTGEKVPARTPGDGKLKAIEDAPGSYVKVRAPE